MPKGVASPPTPAAALASGPLAGPLPAVTGTGEPQGALDRQNRVALTEFDKPGGGGRPRRPGQPFHRNGSWVSGGHYGATLTMSAAHSRGDFIRSAQPHRPVITISHRQTGSAARSTTRTAVGTPPPRLPT